MWFPVNCLSSAGELFVCLVGVGEGAINERKRGASPRPTNKEELVYKVVVCVRGQYRVHV